MKTDDHGIIYFKPLSYVKDESHNNSSQSNSSSSSSSSIDNQSDSDEDNGADVDGSLNENTKPTNWNIEMTLDSTAWGKGSMTIKGVKIDCSNSDGIDNAFSGKRCAIAEYSEQSSKFSFSGVLSADDGVLELAIMTQDIELNVLMPQYQNQAFHFYVNTLDNPYGMNDTFGCNTLFKDEYLQNFKTNKAFSITSAGNTNSCKLTFTPLK